MSTRPNSVTHPRGRLPARVYWLRRSILIGTALVLVFGFAHLLGGVGGGGSPSQQADLAASGAKKHTTAPSSTSPSTGPSIGASAGVSAHRTASPSATPSSALAQPDGPCAAQDLSVTPVVTTAYAVHHVAITLELSGARPACTFTVSPKTLAVKIVSGQDRVWSSQDCPASIAKGSVVVRSGAETAVRVTWNGRRSNGTCSRANAWARPGYYHVLGAVIGSTPADTQFKLTIAPRAVVTKTAKPKPHSTPTPSHTASPSHTATKKPSSGASGTGTKCGGDNAAGSC